MPDVREKLVELIINSVGGCSRYWAGVIADGLIAGGVTIQRWIPVTEEKPQEFVSVLIYVPGEAPLPTVHEAYLARGCWVTHTAILTEREVTHWMEMPAGPESKK